MSRTTAYRMVSSGTLPARQLCGGRHGLSGSPTCSETLCAAKPMPDDRVVRYLEIRSKISFLYKGITRLVV
ncbi:hypothetical protein QA635_33185 [Bradyrhizobium brasilense]|uniref:hypothetical protein n=1 Tax=Bradyrhizobium brasilense TaxID=1419277 RepID=UPI0024B1F2DA|nr:hypothetical protein [Bradyrhizobium australafricanum]WFU37097.1 hypothetical protein QA635_33185 [Bradyrhizobium australafricanum]